MKSVAMLVVVGLLLFVLAACGGAASAPAEPAVADVTAEVAAPTSQPTAAPVEPTAAPTATAEPTAKPTKEPPPEVSLATLVGLFTQHDDQAGGNNWLLFNEDGTVAGRHGPTFDTGLKVFEGTFSLDGNVLTLILPEECLDGERYELRFATATQLHFDVLDTTCDAYADDFQRLPNWKRVEP
ncbi:hypothetical protein [Promineifilum sp.]|uniref:hypothetical protein n=1 Tax=Promineifilum sp. TaxID=2664178 RepID=UPI0035B32FD3